MARSRLKLLYVRIPGASRDPPRAARAVPRWTPAFAGDAVGGGRVERLNHRHRRHGSTSHQLAFPFPAKAGTHPEAPVRRRDGPRLSPGMRLGEAEFGA